MARDLINLVGGRIIRANEIELARTENGWDVVGVDPTSARDAAPPPSRPARPALRRPGDRGLGQHRAVRLPRADGSLAYPLPKTGAPAPGPDRRPGGSGLPRGGRGDHRGGGAGPRARGRRLRGARPRAPGRVRRGPLRPRGRPAARVDGGGRRGGPDLRARPRAARPSSSCSPSPSARRCVLSCATTPRRRAGS